MLNYGASEGSSNQCWTPAYPSLIPKWHQLPWVRVNVFSAFRKWWPLMKWSAIFRNVWLIKSACVWLLISYYQHDVIHKSGVSAFLSRTKALGIKRVPSPQLSV